jgi:transcription antitermination factor NusG
MNNLPVCPETPWYAIQVKPRNEKVISTILENKGVQGFLPVYRSRRVWSDRIVQLDVPLFAGYLFCRFDAARGRLPVISTPGVMRIVGIGGVATPIDNTEIQAIQTIVRSGAAAIPWPHLKTGSRVRIERGSLSGLNGILVEVKKQHRLVVSVTLLQRSVAVEIERDWVAPCGPSAVRPGPLPRYR